MSTKQLKEAIEAVDWIKNIEAFFKDKAGVAAIAAANLRVASWALQFENIEKGNPALSFVREMQIAAQFVPVLIGLSLYKPAGSAMRVVLETALYYTYFRTHPTELATLSRGTGYYISRSDILHFHTLHEPDFKKRQERLGLVTRMDKWYGFISSVVHGQIPGQWIGHKGISEITFSKEIQADCIEAFSEGVEIVHRLFLCTVGKELWDNFSPAAKKILISGLSGDLKTFLELDAK